jgi:hypothetical protein
MVEGACAAQNSGATQGLQLVPDVAHLKAQRGIRRWVRVDIVRNMDVTRSGNPVLANSLNGGFR